MKENYLVVRNLALQCALGVSANERAHPQKIYVTCTISGDYSKSMLSDEMKDSVDYTDIVRAIEALVATETFQLIEHLGKRITDVVTHLCVGRSIEVEVRKPNIFHNVEYTAFVCFG